MHKGRSTSTSERRELAETEPAPVQQVAYAEVSVDGYAEMSGTQAMDKVLLTPLMAVLGALAVWASLELGGDVLSRWHGSTWASRWCSLIYSAKMVLDVPTQLYSLQDQRERARRFFV